MGYVLKSLHNLIISEEPEVYHQSYTDFVHPFRPKNEFPSSLIGCTKSATINVFSLSSACFSWTPEPYLMVLVSLKTPHLVHFDADFTV
jgi:hypothetical protein